MTQLNEQLIEFAKEILRVAFDGGSMCGGDIQDMGIKHGLLTEETYDPDKHGDDPYADPGDPYYVFSSILSQYKGEDTQ